MANILVTGGAGFIGSHLIGALLRAGHTVACVDDYSLGSAHNIRAYQAESGFTAYQQDVCDIDALVKIASDHKISHVYHLAANSDIQKSAQFPGIDHHNTFTTTCAVLECMRICGISRMFFASTSAVYGEKTDVKLREQSGGLSPISYYGGAKLASEAFISAYTYMNDFSVTVFRFPNVIGPGLTHGVVFDFIRKLNHCPNRLEILGNGTQCKPYIYVSDLIDAILLVSMDSKPGMEVYNVGVDTATTVTAIADMVCGRMGLEHVEYAYTGGDRGWKGDVPRFEYDLTKIHDRGWQPKHTSDQAVMETLRHTVIEEIV